MAQNTAVSYFARNSQHTVQQCEYNVRVQIVGVVDGNQTLCFYDVNSWEGITGIDFWTV